MESKGGHGDGGDGSDGNGGVEGVRGPTAGGDGAGEALEEGMRRFREVQGVGLGGFKEVWVAKASEATRR
eukprot:3008810-Prymnesium_polylepis.1